MQNLSLKAYNYNQLSVEAKKVVVDHLVDTGWYDYSDIEQASFNQSLSVFSSAFNSVSTLVHTGDEAKNILIQCINRAVQIHAKANAQFADSVKRQFDVEITSIEDAISVAKNNPLSSIATDLYLMDTIVKFLDGTAYQDLTVKDLLAKAQINGRTNLKKMLQILKSRNHAEECIKNHCEDLFFKDGTRIPESLLVNIE